MTTDAQHHEPSVDQRETSKSGIPGGSPPFVAWLVTAGALLLAVVHVLKPELKIDLITLILLASALLPWLGPLFKRIELPGGYKFEFQEFKKVVREQLDQEGRKLQGLADRVERVESFVISGAVTPALQQKLTKALEDYQEYCRDLGMNLEAPSPTVHIASKSERDPVWPGDASQAAYYDGRINRLVVGEARTSDTHIILREYSHHVLSKMRRGESSLGHEGNAIESALASYFPCSFSDDPRYEGRVYKNTRLFTERWDPDNHWDRGEVWGGAFWEVRDLIGRRSADRIMLEAWSASENLFDGETAQRFVQKLLEALAKVGLSKRRDQIRAVFERRKLTLWPG